MDYLNFTTVLFQRSYISLMVLKNSQQLVMIGYTLHPRIMEEEADESLSVLSQSALHRESQISQ